MSVHTGNIPLPSLLTDLPAVAPTTYTRPVASKDPAQSAREARIAALMGKPVRVGVRDGREYEGRLYCIDNKGNIMMVGCKRIQPPLKPDEGEIVAGAVFIAPADLTHVRVLVQDLAEADSTIASSNKEVSPEDAAAPAAPSPA